tara:strand:+ start:1839 stop:2558 length:720 start_codon:yes stop_codon:yes gene_type:complete
LTLKEILQEEWDTSTIQDVSLSKLEEMYTTEGDSYMETGCNFTLSHKKIPSHKLHVIYYNFPELHMTGTKINKTVCDKLKEMYQQDGFEDENSIFAKEDSLLVIINEPVSENIAMNFEKMYSTGLSELKSGLSEQIQKEMKDSKYVMEVNYFRNVHIFSVDTLVRNLLNHSLVPKHTAIRDKQEIQTILKKTNALPHQLPIILRTDPMAKLIRLCPGNLCRIDRVSSKSGESVYYRICK